MQRQRKKNVESCRRYVECVPKERKTLFFLLREAEREDCIIGKNGHRDVSKGKRKKTEKNCFIWIGTCISDKSFDKCCTNARFVIVCR